MGSSDAGSSDAGSASASGLVSFRAALAGLTSEGTAEVVAAFQVGWEVEHVRIQQPPTGQSPTGALPEAGDAPAEWAKRKLLRAAVAIDELPDPPKAVGTAGKVIAQLFANSAAYPDMTDLISAVKDGDAKTVSAAVDDFEKQMRSVLATENAAASLPAAAPASEGPPPQKLMSDAFELGVLLAAVRCGVEACADQTALQNSISLQQVNSKAARAVTLLGSLRSHFPSGAAYAVARHLEDWSAWAAGDPVDTAVPLKKIPGDRAPILFRKTPDMSPVQAAMQSQGKIWESILTGQSEGKDYIVGASYADAADHLLATWSLSLASLLRSMSKTLIGRLTFWGTGILAALFIAAFAVGSLRSDALTGGDKAVIAVGGAIAAVLAAANVHVTRTQVTTAISRMWTLAEPSLVDSEVYEAIAVATRRLPAEGIGGGAGGGQRTFAGQHRRARNGALASGRERHTLPSAAATGANQTIKTAVDPAGAGSDSLH